MEDITQVIQQIKGFNLDDPYSYEKLLIFFELNKIEIPTLIQEIPKGKIVYRSRENFKTLFFDKISEIECPPKECVTKFNRANRPYQSAFYCSDKREISYSEFMEDWLEKPFGSVFNITVGMWETIKNLKVHIIVDRNNLGGEFNTIKGDEWDKNLIQINDFLVEIFKTSAYNNKQIYILTSVISNILLMRSKLDGILFPCVPINGIGLNLVLNSNICINNYLKIKHVTRDTFMTTNNKNRLRADHINIASVDGKLNYVKKLINWS